MVLTCCTWWAYIEAHAILPWSHPINYEGVPFLERHWIMLLPKLSEHVVYNLKGAALDNWGKDSAGKLSKLDLIQSLHIYDRQQMYTYGWQASDSLASIKSLSMWNSRRLPHWYLDPLTLEMASHDSKSHEQLYKWQYEAHFYILLMPF